MFIGIEIGGTKLQLVLGDKTGAIHKRVKLSVAPESGAGGIRDQIKKALPTRLEDSAATAIAVGLGGAVDWRQGRICRSHHIEGWSESDLAGWPRHICG